MGNCKDCKFWVKFNGNCNIATYLFINEKPQRNIIGVSTNSDINIRMRWAFRTGAEFGCVRFENKGVQA